MRKFITIIALLLYTSLLSINLYEIAINTSSFTTHTKIVVAVFNSDGSPIKNATVCVIDDRTYTKTNANGLTDPIAINVSKYDDNNRQTITLLAYKNGYASHIRYNVSVYKNQTKTGIILETYEILNQSDPSIITSYEQNPKYLEDKIIQQYKRGSF